MMYATVEAAVEAIARQVGGTAAGQWPYHDINGAVVFRVLRFDLPETDKNGKPKKVFRPIRPAGAGWEDGSSEAPRPLYGLPDLNGAETVWVVEGEKTVDAARSIELVATTSAHGADSTDKTDWSHLAGKKANIVPDNDAPGRKYAEKAATILSTLDPPASVKIVVLSGLPEHGDIVDFIEMRKAQGLDEAAIRAEIESLAHGASPLVTQSPEDRPRIQELAWENPVPLEPTYAPPLPLDVLPDWLRLWVSATAEATRSASDLAYLLGLTTISLAITRKVSIEVMPSWKEPANLYGCGVADVSEAKSPVFQAALIPVVDWETDERRRMAAVIDECTTKYEILKKRREDAIRAAAQPGAGEADMANAQAATLALAECIVPALPQLIADDASTEALGILLATHGEKLGVFSAEGTPFEIAAGRYSEKANPDVFLKSWSGDMLRVNRVTRDGGVCETPLLACGVTVQPDVLHSMGQVRALRARGFAARWLYAVPEPLVGKRPARSARMDGSIAEEYRRRVRSLLDIPWPEEPAAWPLSREAEEVFYAYRAELEPRLAPDGDLHSIRDWGAKTDRQLLRLAAVLGAADLAGQVSSLHDLVGRPLAGETMERGAYLIRALAQHAPVAFGLMQTTGEAADARYLLDRINGMGVPRATRREIRRVARRFTRDADMEPALEVLCEHGYLRLAERKNHPHGSPATETYEVHPAVLEGPDPRAKRAERPSASDSEQSDPAFGASGTPPEPPPAASEEPAVDGDHGAEPDEGDPEEVIECRR